MDTTTTSAAPGRGMSRLLINRDFTLLWAGQAISTLGDAVFDTTLILWIATRIARGASWSPLAISALLLAVALPTTIVGPLAGVFADRWSKRRTMLATDAMRALLIALLVLAAAAGTRSVAWQLGLIYAIVCLSTSCAQFFGPSRLALIGDVVAPPHRARASGLTQATMNLALIVGPPLAAALVFGVGVPWALAINALSFAVSFAAILAVRTTGVPGIAQRDAHDAAPRGVVGELLSGLRFFGANRVLMAVLVTVVMAMLGAGALNTLDYFFVVRNLHAPARLYGLFGMANGLGSLVGALLAAIFAQRVGVARTFWLSAVSIGVVMLIYARLTAIVPALVVLFVGGLPNAAVNVAVGPLVLQATPRAYVGRVAAVLNPAASLAGMLSTALAGVLLSTLLRGFHFHIRGITVGPIDTIFSAAGLLVIAAGLYAMVRLRGTSPDAGATPMTAPSRANGTTGEAAQHA